MESSQWNPLNGFNPDRHCFPSKESCERLGVAQIALGTNNRRISIGGALMVNCAGCGFLALRNRDTRGLDEAEQNFRDTGRVPLTTNLLNYFEVRPICFAKAFDLREEIQTAGSGAIVDSDAGIKAILEVVQGERSCTSFVHWKQGFTPKEHQESLDRQELKWTPSSGQR